MRAAEARLLDAASDIRVGQGFDVHAFAPGDHVWLGGVRIPFDRSLAGHSDADVCLHALADALYGALGDGDIGAHFPPSDARWRGAASSLFLADAVARVRARGGIVAHLDATLICEAPKIGPHREAMRARIAEIAGVALDRVGVKATTSEGLGFTGRGEGHRLSCERDDPPAAALSRSRARCFWGWGHCRLSLRASAKQSRLSKRRNPQVWIASRCSQ